MKRRIFLAGLPLLLAPGVACAKRPSEIERRESAYNTIIISREGKNIGMIFGVNGALFTESLYNPADPKDLPVNYTRYMTVALAYAPKLVSLLEIGLGGGRTASYLHLHAPRVQVTCAELDPEVIAMAKKHFGVVEDATMKIFARDGRVFVRQARDTYDVIMIDAYRGTFVPFHLLTKEFFTLVKARLAPGGAVVQNIEPNTMLFDAAIATLKSVFANVDLYDVGNIVAVAYDGTPKTEAQLRARAGELQRSYALRYPIADMLPQRAIVRGTAAGKVLTDDFAPVESLRAIQKHNDRSNR
jgi:spermidine synthase